MASEFDSMLEPEPKWEKTAAGALGALRGALAGVVCIVLIGRLNFVAPVSGLVMAVCALKGYEKLSGALTGKGAVISCVIIVIMTYFAHHLNLSVELAQQTGMSFFNAFTRIPKLLRLDLIDGAVFWGNLALLYLFALLGAVPVIRRRLMLPVPPYSPGQTTPANGAQPAPADGTAAPADGTAALVEGTAAPADTAQTESLDTGQTEAAGGIPAASANDMPAAPVDGAQPAPAQGTEALPASGFPPAQQPAPFLRRGAILSLIIVLLFGGIFFAADISNAARGPKQDDAPLVSASEPGRRPDASASGHGAGADADTASDSIGITWENYQSLFRPAGEYGYQHIAVGYLPVPAGAFGENVFVDAYVPDCDAPVYSEDGYTLTAAAHGMRVDITILPTGGDARDAVEAMFDAFAASGADIYEETVSETEYSEEYGVAVRQFFYFEENGALPRMCFFYADAPVNGHCYAARIVYLTEQQDEESPALVEELGDVFGLNLPAIEPFAP